MTETKKIVITGTHLTPAIELIHQLKNDREINWEISYIGRAFNSNIETEASIESKIIPKNNIKFYGISSGKFDRRWLPNTLSGLPKIISAFNESTKLLEKIKPQLIISFGGYVSVPVIIAAWFKKIPSITHEQTLTLSLSTKINSLFCRYVALSFPINNSSDKFIFTGNLLRREIFNPNSSFFEKQKLDLKKYPLIFLTAGNQGSHHLNLILKEILPIISQKYTIIHQCGSKDYSKFKNLSSNFKNYHPYSYIESPDIGWIFHHSKVVIARSGANTVQELAVLHKKNILIPLPVSQQNEQSKNALYLKKKQSKKTIIIKDIELSPQNLLDSIDKLIKIKSQKQKTIPKINFKLLNLIKKL